MRRYTFGISEEKHHWLVACPKFLSKTGACEPQNWQLVIKSSQNYINVEFWKFSFVSWQPNLCPQNNKSTIFIWVSIKGLIFSEKDLYYLQAQTDMPFHYLKLVIWIFAHFLLHRTMFFGFKFEICRLLRSNCWLWPNIKFINCQIHFFLSSWFLNIQVFWAPLNFLKKSDL